MTRAGRFICRVCKQQMGSPHDPGCNAHRDARKPIYKLVIVKENK